MDYTMHDLRADEANAAAQLLRKHCAGIIDSMRVVEEEDAEAETVDIRLEIIGKKGTKAAWGSVIPLVKAYLDERNWRMEQQRQVKLLEAEIPRVKYHDCECGKKLVKQGVVMLEVEEE